MKKKTTKEIELQNQQEHKSFQRILEADQTEKKEKLRNNHLRETGKPLEPNLSSRNLMKGIDI